MSSTMRHKGISILPILVAILVLLALLLPLQAQLQGTSVQQSLRTIQAQAALTADAGGQWLTVQILEHSDPRCPNDLTFSDPQAPELSVSLGCQAREYDQAKQFDLEVEVQYQQPSHPDYVRQHYQWVLAL